MLYLFSIKFKSTFNTVNCGYLISKLKNPTSKIYNNINLVTLIQDIHATGKPFFSKKCRIVRPKWSYFLK